jgi:hypothetical protein
MDDTEQAGLLEKLSTIQQNQVSSIIISFFIKHVLLHSQFK